jgi:hypothetical protein
MNFDWLLFTPLWSPSSVLQFLSGWCYGGVAVGAQKDMLVEDYIV